MDTVSGEKVVLSPAPRFMKAEKCLSFLGKENGLNEGWLGSISNIILLIDKEKCLEGKVCKNFLNPKVPGHL